MFYSVPYLTTQMVNVNTGRKRAILLFLLVICLVFIPPPSECSDWTEGLDNSVRNGTAWIISESVSQPDKYFQIQSHRSQKYLTAQFHSDPKAKAQPLDKNYLDVDEQIWTVHSTMGFPFFSNGSFSPLFEISSFSSSQSSQKTSYILNSLRMWRLKLVQFQGEVGETFIIYRPLNESCVVETENFQDETQKSWSIELEDCETTSKNKLWTFLPVPERLQPQANHLGLEHQSFETDFDTNSQEK